MREGAFDGFEKLSISILRFLKRHFESRSRFLRRNGSNGALPWPPMDLWSVAMWKHSVAFRLRSSPFL